MSNCPLCLWVNIWYYDDEPCECWKLDQESKIAGNVGKRIMLGTDPFFGYWKSEASIWLLLSSE